MNRHAALFILLAVLSEWPSAVSAIGQVSGDVHLKANVSITLGGQNISLPSGSTVKILQKTADKAVISLKLADGTPIITQVALGVLEFPTAPLPPPAPAGPTVTATNPVDSKTAAPAAAGNSTSPTPAALTTSTPATTIPTDTATANNILKSPGAPAVDSSAAPQPDIDPAVLLSRLGAPVEVTQPDFPEPDPDLKTTQLTVDISNHPEIASRVKVVYAIPLDKEGKPGPRAHHILFYCPWYKQGNPLADTFNKFFCGNLGLTVVSLQIAWASGLLPADAAKPADQPINGNPPDQNVAQTVPVADGKSTVDINFNNYTQQDIYAQLAFEAQTYIETKYGLKHEPLIVYGNSSGSDMAERMAIHYQDKIACVFLMAGGVFEEPKIKPTIPWFVMDPRGDANNAANQNLLESLHALDARPGSLTIEPEWDGPNWLVRGSELFHHVISDDGFSMFEAYVWDVVQKLDASNAAPLTPESWPYLTIQGFPADVYTNNPTSLPSLPSIYFTLPGKTSAFYYSKLQSRQLVTSTSYKSSLWSIDAISKPKGLIIYDDNFDYLSIGRIVDDMYCFSDHGYSVIFTKGPSINLPDLINWIQSDPKYRDLPLFAFGLGSRAPPLLNLAQNDLKGKFKGVAFYDYALDEAGQNPLQLKQPEADCPVFYVFDTSLSGLSDGRISEIKEYVQNPPLESFNSKFGLIDSKKNPDISAQKAVTAIETFFDGI